MELRSYSRASGWALATGEVEAGRCVLRQCLPEDLESACMAISSQLCDTEIAKDWRAAEMRVSNPTRQRRVGYFLKSGLCRKAGMAELADAADSKSAEGNLVGVRPPSRHQDSKRFTRGMASLEREAIFVGGCSGGCWFSARWALLLWPISEEVRTPAKAKYVWVTIKLYGPS